MVKEEAEETTDNEMVFTARSVIAVPVPRAEAGSTVLYLVPEIRGVGGISVSSKEAVFLTTDSPDQSPAGVVTIGDSTSAYPPWRSVPAVPLIRVYGRTR